MTIEPGDWHGGEEVETDPFHKEGEAHDLEFPEGANISTKDSKLGEAVSLFVDAFGTPRKILYPGCGNNVIDELFPDSEIVYVDPSAAGIALIQQHIGERAKAIALPIEAFDATPEHDLLFSLNTHADMEEQLKRVKPEGFVFCNNYIGTKDAEYVLRSGTCRLRAVIVPESDGEDEGTYQLQTERLEEYLAPKELPEGEDEKFHILRQKVATYYIFEKKA